MDKETVEERAMNQQKKQPVVNIRVGIVMFGQCPSSPVWDCVDTDAV
jgi:hypothetical protein